MTAHQRIDLETLRVAPPKVGWPIELAMVAAVATYLHAICWMTVPPDMTLFLFPWYDHILENGRVAAFGQPFSNYTPAYLYMLSAASLADPLLSPLHVIKLLSLAGTGFLALAVANLLMALGAEGKRAVWVCALPSVILNAALLGQCDALWAGACILAVAAIIRGRTIACLVWCGVAIAFKAQAVFLAPFIMGALIGRKAPFWQWAIPPGVYALLMLPAWLAGWPAGDLATVYLRQAEWFSAPGNLANPWVWASSFGWNGAPSWYWAGYAAAAGAALAVGAASATAVRRPMTMMVLATLSAFAIPFLLPKMHERYFFLADVLALTLVLAWPNRRNLAIAIGVQLASLSALLSYIYNWPPLVLAGSIIASATLVLAYSVVSPSHSSSWWRRSASSLVA